MSTREPAAGPGPVTCHISLAQTAARTRRQMYWSGMQIPAGGSGLIAIAARLTGPGGRRLEPGVYAYY